MGWSTPRTWQLGEYPTSAEFNQEIRDNLQYLFDQMQALSGQITTSTAAGWKSVSGISGVAFEQKADTLQLLGPTPAGPPQFNDYFFMTPELVIHNDTGRTVAGMANTQIGSIDVEIHPNAFFECYQEVSVNGGAFGGVSPGNKVVFDTSGTAVTRTTSVNMVELFWLTLDPGQSATFRFGHRFRVYAPAGSAGTLHVGGDGYHRSETLWILGPTG